MSVVEFAEGKSPWQDVDIAESINVPVWASKIQVLIPTLVAGAFTPQVSSNEFADTTETATLVACLTDSLYPTVSTFVGNVFEEFFDVPSGPDIALRFTSSVPQTAKVKVRFVE